MSGSRSSEDHEAATRRNEELAIAAESQAAPVVRAAPMKVTFEFTADCNIHCFETRDSFDESLAHLELRPNPSSFQSTLGVTIS